MARKYKFITVIGGDKDAASKEACRMAEEVGKLIAKAGAVLVCGGLGGTMEAAARGAKSEGGLTIGILPGSRREEANPYIDVPIITGMGYARNKIVVKTGQAIIAIDGKYGTLSEIAFALGYGIPVIGLKTWELIHGDGRVDQGIIRANTPKEAVEMALKCLSEVTKPRKRTREKSI
jgi:uncharacterized protein (TIGR00725 family)